MHCANCSSLFELGVVAAPEPLAPDGGLEVGLGLVDEPPQPASSRSAATIAVPPRIARCCPRVSAGTAFPAPVEIVRIVSKSFAPSLLDRKNSLDIKNVTISRLMRSTVHIPVSAAHGQQNRRQLARPVAHASSLSRPANAVPELQHAQPTKACA
jgi:hypothetical protein